MGSLSCRKNSCCLPKIGVLCPHTPNYKKALGIFAIHAGGKAKIQAIKENIKLHDKDLEASKMTFQCSSVWYSLGYL